MAVVQKNNSAVLGSVGSLIRRSDTSASGAAVTVSSVAGAVYRLVMVTVKYTAAATVNVTTTLNSGAGAAYDAVLNTIALSAATGGSWVPDIDIFICDDDTIDVLAPLLIAETVSVTLYLEAIRRG